MKRVKKSRKISRTHAQQSNEKWGMSKAYGFCCTVNVILDEMLLTDTLRCIFHFWQQATKPTAKALTVERGKKSERKITKTIHAHWNAITFLNHSDFIASTYVRWWHQWQMPPTRTVAKSSTRTHKHARHAKKTLYSLFDFMVHSRQRRNVRAMTFAKSDLTTLAW